MPDFFVGPGIHDACRGLSWWETSKLLPYNRQRFPARHDRLLCSSIANSLSLLENFKPRCNTSFVSPRDYETRKIMVWNSSLKLSTTTSKSPHKRVQRWHENKLIQKNQLLNWNLPVNGAEAAHCPDTWKINKYKYAIVKYQLPFNLTKIKIKYIRFD